MRFNIGPSIWEELREFIQKARGDTDTKNLKVLLKSMSKVTEEMSVHSSDHK
jgi:hypothetical protein